MESFEPNKWKWTTKWDFYNLARKWLFSQFEKRVTFLSLSFFDSKRQLFLQCILLIGNQGATCTLQYKLSKNVLGCFLSLPQEIWFVIVSSTSMPVEEKLQHFFQIPCSIASSLDPLTQQTIHGRRRESLEITLSYPEKMRPFTMLVFFNQFFANLGKALVHLYTVKGGLQESH